MNDLQVKHYTEITDEFNGDNWEKYSNGTVEHNGLLSDMPALELLQNLNEEVLDLVNYLYTFKKKLITYFNDPLIKNRMAEIDRLEKLVADRKTINE